jgi:hypothetical protein
LTIGMLAGSLEDPVRSRVRQSRSRTTTLVAGCGHGFIRRLQGAVLFTKLSTISALQAATFRPSRLALLVCQAN